MKEVLGGTKELLPINEVRRVNMPPFDELSVKALWPDMKGNKEFMKFFPSKFPAGRLPDRTYFFNIMNTTPKPQNPNLINCLYILNEKS